MFSSFGQSLANYLPESISKITSAHAAERKPVAKAVAKLTGDNIHGVVTFLDMNGSVQVQAEIFGLSEGKHGIHVHEFGDTTDGCNSAGPHFNPLKKTHGGLKDSERHVGDLGNLVCPKNGACTLHIEDKLISLSNPERNILGRTLVIHRDADDEGKGGHELSKTTGNSGPRVACGVIGLGKL